MNKSALFVVDVDTAILDVNYTKYLIQAHERHIEPYWHGTCQQFLKSSDLNKLFGSLPINFRSIRKGEDLKGKLVMNRIGNFGVCIHE